MSQVILAKIKNQAERDCERLQDQLAQCRHDYTSQRASLVHLISACQSGIVQHLESIRSSVHAGLKRHLAGQELQAGNIITAWHKAEKYLDSVFSSPSIAWTKSASFVDKGTRIEYFVFKGGVREDYWVQFDRKDDTPIETFHSIVAAGPHLTFHIEGYPYVFCSLLQNGMWMQNLKFNICTQYGALLINEIEKAKGQLTVSANFQTLIKSVRDVDVLDVKFTEQIQRLESEEKRKLGLVARIDALKAALVHFSVTVVLPSHVHDLIVQNVLLFLAGDTAAPKGMLLFGPPGTGKTSIARAMAHMLGASFFSLTISDIKSQWLGKSSENIAKIWSDAEASKPSVVFIDECEGIFQKRGGLDSDKITDEIIGAVLPKWDGLSTGSGILVVGATNRRDILDPAILSRFDSLIEIPQPTGHQRATILLNELRKHDIAFSTPPAYLPDVTEGLTGRDLAMCAKEIKAASMKGPLTHEVIKKIVNGKRGAGATNVGAKLGWEDLILPDVLMKKLKATAHMIVNRDKLRVAGFEVPKGFVLYGPPGTGKTQIARVLAGQCGIPFYAASTADLKGSFVGHSGQRVKEFFEKARGSSASIIFIDEIDIVAPDRSTAGGNTDQFTNEIVGQLLQELDGVKASPADIFVFAASNKLVSIDSAIRSRFTEEIEIPLPGLPERIAMLTRFLAGISCAADVHTQIAVEAERMHGFSGRDIRNVVKKAQQHCIQRAMASGDMDNLELHAEDVTTAIS